MLQIVKKKKPIEEEKQNPTDVTIHFRATGSAEDYTANLRRQKGTFLELEIFYILNKRDWISQGYRLGKDKHVPPTFFIDGIVVDGINDNVNWETRDITEKVGDRSYKTQRGFYTNRVEGTNMVVDVRYIPKDYYRR